MTKRRKRVLIGAAVVAAAIAGLTSFAETVLPDWLRGAIERSGTEALGRKIAITGAFEVTFVPKPGLTARDVVLANAAGAPEPAMVRVDRVAIRLDALSLLSRPVRLRDVSIVGARVVLERDETGRGNWVFETETVSRAPSPAPRRLPVVVEHAAVRDFVLTYRSRPGASPLRIGVSDLDARLDPSNGMVDLRAGGDFNEAPWKVSGTLGTLEQLYRAQDVDHALTGTIGGSTVTVRGRIRDPLALRGPNVEIGVSGPDVATAASVFGVRAPATGPYHLGARLSSDPDGVDADVSLETGALTVSAQGGVSALLDPSRIDATVEAKGPDASAVGRWIGVANLPPRPFEVAGRVRRFGSGLALDAVKLRAGGTSLTVSGTVGPPPRCDGTALAVTAAGANLSELSALTGLRLPPGTFAAHGRFLRRSDGLAIEGAEIRLRDAVVRATGTIGEPPRLDALDLTIDASGPDAAPFSTIARVDLPSDPFVLRGRLSRRGDALALDGVEIGLGENSLGVTGSVVPERRLIGTDVVAHLRGPDLAALGGRLGLSGVPPEPFEVSGRLRIGPGGYDLDGVEARAGRLHARLDGHLGNVPELDGTALAGRVEGPALSDLLAWGVPVTLPSDPFTVAGKLGIAAGAYRVDGAVATVGRDRIGVDGTLGVLPGLSDAEVTVHVSGPSLAALSRFVPRLSDGVARRLPVEPYEVGGELRRVAGGIELRGVTATVGGLDLDVAGTVGTAGSPGRIDLRFGARAPDTTLLSAVAGHALPEGPFAASGRVERVLDGYRIENLTAAAGASRVKMSGTLGDPPGLAGTDLDVDASGADLADALGALTGVSPLPTGDFDVAAHVTGSATAFAAEPLTAHLAGNRVAGSVSVRLEGKPTVDADLRAGRLDVAALLGGTPEESPSGPEASAPKPTKKQKKSRKERGLLLPDRPLELGPLRALDARLVLAAQEVLLPGVPLRDVVVEGDLRDGALRLSRIEGTGAKGGRASATLSLEPSGGAVRLNVEGRLDRGRLDLSKTGGAPEEAPSLDVEFELEGSGDSLHAIAASGDGRVLVVVGPGRIPNSVGNLATSGLLDALNPFRKSSPYTDFECGIAAASLEGGKAAVGPVAARTDKMTVLGKGTVDFRTEAIDLGWTIKPRQGIGITAGSIANPYIKLGGTLSAPSIEGKPLEATASTGAAVATAGLTILFRGIYNRITAEKKVCVDALEKAEKAEKKRKSRKEP